MKNTADKSKQGIVYLIGAGPGDPGLITVRGMELLNTCDAVVYDNLIPDEIVIAMPPEIEKYHVGKKAARHPTPQSEINALLVKLAGEGKKVARLKGSDPMIFGRGGEEAKYLNKHGVAFEIVPGVTSGIAVPTYSGIPCTDRELASMVMFVTGHKAIDKQLSSVQWDLAAKMKTGTLVIYMGVGEIEIIVEKLIEGGMDPERPAAVAEHGTLPTQRTFTTVLKKLPETVKNENVRPPAIFIIGEVVRLKSCLNWYGGGPLFGKRIMVTRPPDQAKDMYLALRRLGGEVLPYPTITTEKYVDNAAWNAFDGIDSDNKWLILTSENGVRYFFEQFFHHTKDIRSLGHFRIAAVGFGTARALEQVRIKADFIPTKATTASLAKELTEKENIKGATVVRVRGNLADDRIERVLSDNGAEIIPLTVYRTSHPVWPEGFKEKLFERPPDFIVFTSGSTATGLCAMLSEDELKKLIEGKIIVSIGPSTTKIINSHGMEVSLEAKEHSVPGVIKEIVEFVLNRKGS